MKKPAYLSVWMAALCATCIATSAMAQPASYPSKPITLIVGFTPGGISDVLSRALAARLTAQMGQSVIVENKTGAGTTIASAFPANPAKRPQFRQNSSNSRKRKSC